MVHLAVPALADYRERITLYFDDASLELEFPSPYLNHQPTRLTLRKSDGHTLSVQEIRSGFEEAFVEELKGFWSAIVEGTPVRNTAEAGAARHGAARRSRRSLPRPQEAFCRRWRTRVKVRIGINPITWTNDDVPELGGDTPLEVCLAETKQAGYAGTELGGKFPRQSSELKPIMDRYGLAVVSGWYDGRCDEKDVDAEMEAITPHLQLLKDMGATHVVYADTSRGRHGAIWDPISKRPSLSADEWPGYGRKLTKLAERMADFGVRMAFHHHMGTIVETDDEVGLLMKHTGEAVGLLYDTGHSIFSGGDPLTLARTHVKRIVHVHCKDARPSRARKGARRGYEFHGRGNGRHIHGAGRWLH